MTESLTKTLKKKKGFTLIELIIVVAIIAILAALAIPKLMGTQDNAKKKADIANGKMIHDTVAKLLTEGSVNPTAAEDFAISSSATGDGVTVWSELQSKPKATYKNHTTFYVSIDANKNITVRVDSASGDEVYPDQTGNYQ